MKRRRKRLTSLYVPLWRHKKKVEAVRLVLLGKSSWKLQIRVKGRWGTVGDNIPWINGIQEITQ